MPRIVNDNTAGGPGTSRTELTDGLYSGMNTFYMDANRPPFWGEEIGLMSGQFSGSVVPVAPVARGYMSDFYHSYKPAGEYRTEVPDEAGRYLPPMASEVGKSIVAARDYFNA
jgi:hypothetical protein